MTRSFAQPEWRISDRPVDYPAAVAEMEARVAAIAGGTAPELIWLLEHPPMYTAGTSADPRDLLQADRFPVHPTGRGGQYTTTGRASGWFTPPRSWRPHRDLRTMCMGWKPG